MRSDKLLAEDAIRVDGSPDGWDHLTRVTVYPGSVAIESAEGLGVTMLRQELPPELKVMRGGRQIHPEARS